MISEQQYRQGQPPYDFERDIALTVTQFMLSPDIPPSERKHFNKFYLMFSKIMALGNIKRSDVFGIIVTFKEIVALMEMGQYDEARVLMAEEIMKMQVSRSVDGFQTLYGQGVQRTEQIERIFARRQRRSLSGRLSSAFRRKKESEESEWEEIPRM